MSVANQRRLARTKRQVRVRRKIRGSEERPRLCIFRSSKHIYVQIIEDVTGRTLVAASTVSNGIVEGVKCTGNIEAAKVVGQAIAKKALEKNIKQVVFDRNGFLYHGRIQAQADAAHEAGLSY